MNNGLTKEALLFTLPRVLKDDESLAALGEMEAEALVERVAETDLPRILSNIDQADERVLDILARDFKVDWWDPNYSLEEKRRTLKDSWYVHKHMGTKSAVERAIRAIYTRTTVEEWFEYGGDPYHFRLNIDITSDGGDRDRQRRVLQRLNFYKNLRSHNDGVRYLLYPEKAWAVAGGSFMGSREKQNAVIVVPPLLPPGGTFSAIAWASITGSRERQNAVIVMPPLETPGGRTKAGAWAAFTGTRRRDSAMILLPPLETPGGAASMTPWAAFTGTRRRDTAKIQTPELVRPQGGDTRDAAAGFFGERQRVSVRVRTRGAGVAPTGRGGPGSVAGAFHTYARVYVRIDAG